MHKKNMRTSALLLVVFILALLLAGCGGISAEPPEPVTISFAHPDVETEYFNLLLEEFNQTYPYITVELQLPEMGDADIFVDIPFNLVNLLNEGSILSVDPLLELDTSFDRDDFHPGTMALFSRAGQQWAIPAGVDTILLYYNQDLFDQAGIPYPTSEWTWDDFISAGYAIRGLDEKIFGYVSLPHVEQLDTFIFLYHQGGSIFDSLDRPTRMTFDNPATIQALTWYNDLLNDYNVAPTPEQRRQVIGGGQSGAYRALFQNRIGMWLAWYSDRGGVQWDGNEWNFNWGVVPVPQSETPFTTASSLGYFISSEAEHPEACWQWISFISRQVPDDLIPSRQSIANASQYEGAVGEGVATVARSSLEDVVLLSPELFAFEDDVEIFYQAVDKVINGNLTPAEAMEWAQLESEG